MSPVVKILQAEQIDGDDKYFETGVPKDWIEPIKTLGFTTIAKLKKIEKPYC